MGYQRMIYTESSLPYGESQGVYPDRYGFTQYVFILLSYTSQLQCDICLSAFTHTVFI